MKRLITIETEVPDAATFDDVFYALVGAIVDRLQCGDERGDLLARSLVVARHPSGGSVGFS